MRSMRLTKLLFIYLILWFTNGSCKSNVAVTTATGSCKHDVSGACVTIVKPAGATISNSKTPSFQWSASVTGQQFTTTMSESVPSSSVKGSTGTSFTPPAPLSDGKYVLYVWTLSTTSNLWELYTTVTITVDTTPPTVQSLSSPAVAGTYSAGSSIEIHVVFSEAVYVTGSATIQLATSPGNGMATYKSGSGTADLVFIYQVGAADQTTRLNVNSASALNLSGSIKDAAGNDASLTLPTGSASGSLGSNSSIAISNTSAASTPSAPTSSPAAGTYTSTQSVALSTTSIGAAIYYTTNGSTPTTASTLYSSAISVSTTTTIKYIAVNSGGSSAVSSATYTINIPSAAQALVFTNTSSYVMRKVTSAGIINTNFGISGTSAYGGAGGVATSATGIANGVTTDSAGNIYFTDAASSIRVIAAVTGTVFGQAVTAGNVYTLLGDGSTQACPTNGALATASKLYTQHAIAVDSSGNLYFSDCNQIWVIAATTSTIFGVSATANRVYLIAGTGSMGNSGNGGAATAAQLYASDGIAFDAAGNLFMTSSDNTIRVVAKANGSVFGQAVSANNIYGVIGISGTGTTTGDGGLATSATTYGPVGIAFDSSGNLFFAESSGFVIRVIAAASTTVFGVAITTNKVYTIAGTATVTAPVGDGGFASAAHFNFPGSIAFDNLGNLFIWDCSNYEVRVIAAANGTVMNIAMTANRIYSVAGNSSSAGNSGDGGAATSATITLLRGALIR